MRSTRIAFLIAALMLAASIGAIVARPGEQVAGPGSSSALEAVIPAQFGDWREEPRRVVLVVNPQQRASVDNLYSQLVERVYVHADGYRIMLSIAYGPDQRGRLRAHDPESCYPAQGFALHRREASQLATPFGEIPVRRLFTSNGSRVEPLTYWVKIGDKVVQGWQTRLVELSYTLSGRIPDGLVFRVSSLDSDQAHANRLQDLFIEQLLQALSPAERMRLTGLGGSQADGRDR